MKYILPIVLCFLILSCKKEYKVIDKVNSLSYKLNGEQVNVGLEATFPYSSATIQDSNKFDIFMVIPYSNGLGTKNFIAISSVVKNFDKQVVTAVYKPLIWNDSTVMAFNEQTRNVTNAVFYNSITGGDSPCEEFMPDSNDVINNWVKNTSMEDNFKVVEGTFNLKLIKVSDCPDENYPDILHITEGKYHLNLEE